MSALTYFTAIGTFLAAAADSTSDVDADPDLVPVFGRVRFTPLIRAGDSIQGTTLTPPSSLLLRPITVPLVGGQLSLNGTTGVRLVANTSALNLTGALFYQVDFFDLQAVSDSLDLRSFSFTAPTVDTTVDLVSVAPVTGTLAGGTTVGPQGPTGPAGPTGPQGPTGPPGAGLAATPVKTSAYTAAASDLIPVDATGGAVTVTLPAAPPDKSRVVVKKIDASVNAVTVARGGSDVFNVASGATSLSLLLQYQAVVLQYATSGAIWYVTSTDAPLAGLDARYQATITPGTTSQYWRGDKTFQTLDKTVVGLGNVDNTSDATKNTATAALSNKDLTAGTNTFPTLNQNTTGSAAKLTTPRNINGVAFDGTANITVADSTKLAASAVVDNSDGTITVGSVTGMEPLTPASAVVTASTAPVIGQITLYNATSGNLTPSLPALSGIAAGRRLAVGRDPADVSTNTVTFSLPGGDTFYSSGSTSFTMPLAGERREFQVISVSATKYWVPAGSLNPLTGLDARYQGFDTTVLTTATGRAIAFAVALA